jgi:hypothetical protein
MPGLNTQFFPAFSPLYFDFSTVGKTLAISPVHARYRYFAGLTKDG